MNILRVLLVAALMLAMPCLADEQDDATEKATETAAAAQAQDDESKLTGADKKRLQDEAVAAMVEEYNEAVEDDLDEVVCKKQRVTGTRRSVRICKTRREILEEEAAADRALRMRNRAASDPAAAQGMGSN